MIDILLLALVVLAWLVVAEVVLAIIWTISALILVGKDLK